MSWYLFYQSEFGESNWDVALDSMREELESSGKAKLTTALAVDNDFEEGSVKPEDVSYKGDMYFDFDSGDILDSINDVKVFLGTLKDKYGIDLGCVRVYASGKKGFHLFIPNKCFIEKPALNGYKYLPNIYKEMYLKVALDTMDFRVYSAKKGRMLRVANVQRQNGMYKVPILAAEALCMTPEMYALLIKAPRKVTYSEPKFSGDAALLWSQAKDKVERALKTQKGKQRDAGLLKKFEGKAPPSVEALCAGEGVKDGVGFHAIAMQLAITAHSLTWTEEVFLEKARGLCERHHGDGDRYNTYAKRRRELSRMWYVIEGSAGYDWSAGAIKTLIEGDAPDLNTLAATDMNEDGSCDLAITMGITFDKSGIYSPNDEGVMIKRSVIGFDNVRQLFNLQTKEVIGYSAELWTQGKFSATRVMPTSNFTSKAKFNEITMRDGSGCQLTDAQTIAIYEIFRRVSHGSGENEMIYIVPHEGLGYVTLKDGTRDVVWTSGSGNNSRSGLPFMFRHPLGKGDRFVFDTDLMRAPDLLVVGEAEREGALSRAEMETCKDTLHNLLRITNKKAAARLGGWHFATFLAPFIRDQLRCYPLLHVYAMAGSGKSGTVSMFSNLWYYQNQPKSFGVAGATKYALQEAMTGSTSLPMIADEYKPHTMPAHALNTVRDLLRNSFDGNSIAKGQVDRDRSTSGTLGVTHADVTTPVCFIAEAMETETALVERSVIVSLDARSRDRGTAHFNAIFNNQNQKFLGCIGKVLAGYSMRKVEPQQVKKWVLDFEEEIRLLPQARLISHRTIRGLAITATGLLYARGMLRPYFGSEFDDILNELMNEITHSVESLAPIVRSEAAKVLGTMSFLTQTGLDDQRIIEGKDYIVTADWVEIHGLKCFVKYQGHCRRVNETPLYPSYPSFARALESLEGVTNSPNPSPLISPNGRNVFRLDKVAIYENEDVEPFRSDR